MHTYPVRYDALTAEIELPGAQLIMTADGDSLTMRLTGSDEERFEAAKEFDGKSRALVIVVLQDGDVSAV